jgi:hypothetical protein
MVISRTLAEGTQCIDNHRHHWTQVDGCECASMDLHGSACASLDQYGSECASTDQSEPIQASTDVNMPVFAGMDSAGCSGANTDQDKPVRTVTDQSKPGCSDPDQDKPVHTGSDEDAPACTCVDHDRPDWTKAVEDIVVGLLSQRDEALVSFTQSLQHTLQKMATQCNIAITALCEASEDIRNCILTLNTRMINMEEGLDMDAADPLELYQPENRIKRTP